MRIFNPKLNKKSKQKRKLINIKKSIDANYLFFFLLCKLIFFLIFFFNGFDDFYFMNIKIFFFNFLFVSFLKYIVYFEFSYYLHFLLCLNTFDFMDRYRKLIKFFVMELEKKKISLLVLPIYCYFLINFVFILYVLKTEKFWLYLFDTPWLLILIM